MDSAATRSEHLRSGDLVKHHGGMYKSPIWTITFGATGYTYNVHESILKQSTILGAMCKDGFSEATMKRIDLPEKEAPIFHHLISYLYRGDIDPPEDSKDNIKGPLLAKVEELTRLYMLADKYLFDGLKKQIVQKLERVTDWREHRCEFIDIAKQFYDWIPVTDYIFRQFFFATMDALMSCMTFTDHKYFIEIIGEGGLLAMDMYKQILEYEYSVLAKYTSDTVDGDWSTGPTMVLRRAAAFCPPSTPVHRG
ncbi:hypothetical protein MMC30_002882 [Trapelia coarctata]|nr:hypothetical protein [Trapelia coarctata]